MKLALIGGGMVGQCFGQALAKSGLTICGIWDMKPSQTLRDFASSHGTGVHVEAGTWLADADLVISAVFGTAALEVAEAAQKHLVAGSLYVDMTTADPDDMGKAAEIASTRLIDFVDVAISGAVDMHREKTPLLCSGPKAADVAEIFRTIGSPIQIVGERAGDATSLKLMRSVFTKGFEALTIECLTTATKRGLRPQLQDILSDMDRTPVKHLMESIVRTHIEHAGRRRNEIVEAQRLVRMAGIEPLVLPGAQLLYERTMEAKNLHPYNGSTVDDALQWLIAAADNIETCS